MEESFSFKWNDFQENISNSFALLQKEDYLHDVTLVGDDNHQISAHKVVLSSSSEYFKNIFKNNKHPHPLICLNGVLSQDLNNILNYVYNGEVEIHQDDLESFLSISERLKLGGLQPHKIQMENTNSVPPETLDESSADVIKEVEMKKTDNRYQAKSQEDKDLDNKLKVHTEWSGRNGNDGTGKCLLCGKLFSRYQVLLNHIETHMNGLCFPCNHCKKTFKVRESLRMHNYRRHRNIENISKTPHVLTPNMDEDQHSFPCNYCEKTFRVRETLRRHNYRHHRHLNRSSKISLKR